MTKIDEKTAPVQRYHGRIEWDVHLRAWEAYNNKWHSGQTAERIAERGGFAADELDELYPEWRIHTEELPRLREQLRLADEMARAWLDGDCDIDGEQAALAYRNARGAK